MTRYTGPETMDFICSKCHEPILSITRYFSTEAIFNNYDIRCGKCNELVMAGGIIAMKRYKQRKRG